MPSCSQDDSSEAWLASRSLGISFLCVVFCLLSLDVGSGLGDACSNAEAEVWADAKAQPLLFRRLGLCERPFSLGSVKSFGKKNVVSQLPGNYR